MQGFKISYKNLPSLKHCSIPFLFFSVHFSRSPTAVVKNPIPTSAHMAMTYMSDFWEKKLDVDGCWADVSISCCPNENKKLGLTIELQFV